ncbi:MAG TPA: hypothetical protein VJ719_06320 [Chthoniobacterales bacterium]|nr:hypothetical protein [Chthoniobacterales bacterium]
MKFQRAESRRSWIRTTIAISAICSALSVHAAELSPAEAKQIGKRIWQNECNGTISGLTSWNSGENFASLGIGHFIWYPKGQNGPFDESFPRLVAFMSARGAKLPSVAKNAEPGSCPWNNRSEFVQAQDSAEMKQLREFLANTVDLQSQFLVTRLSQALPKMLAEAARADQSRIRANFERLLNTPQGCYALVDYVNFKGEGVLQSERYHGQGWGLLQVLAEMRPDKTPAETEFSRAAASVLRRRVQNAPPERNEQRWLAGWLKRVNSYSRD